MLRALDTLSPNERKSIYLLGVVVGFALVYFLLLQPIWRNLQKERVNFIENTAVLTTLTQATPAIKALKQAGGTPEQVRDSDLINVLEESLAGSPLADFEKNLHQVDNSHIEIQWKAVPFDLLADWIDTLWHTTSIEVTQLQATPTETKGMVMVVCQLHNRVVPEE